MKVIYWVSLLGAVLLLANFALLTVCTLPQVPWLKSKDEFDCGVNGAEVSAELTLSLWTRKHCALKWGQEGACTSTCTVDKWNRIDCSTSRPEDEEGDHSSAEGGGEGEGERRSWPGAMWERKALEEFKVLNHTEDGANSTDVPYCYKFDKAARTAAGMVIAGMVTSLASFILCLLGFFFLDMILPPHEPEVQHGESLAVVSSSSDLMGMEEEAESKRQSMEITRVTVADDEDGDALSPPSSCLNGLYDIATASKVMIEWSPVTQLIFSIVSFCLYLSSVIAYPVISDSSGWEEDHKGDYEPYRGEGEPGGPHLHLAAGWYLLLTALIVQAAAILCFSLFVHWFFHYSSKKFLNLTKSPSTPVLAIVQQEEMTEVS